jgi:hypothetical protein
MIPNSTVQEKTFTPLITQMLQYNCTYLKPNWDNYSYDDKYGSYVNYYTDKTSEWKSVFFGKGEDNTPLPSQISNNLDQDYIINATEEERFKNQLDLHWFSDMNDYISKLSEVQLLYVHCFAQISGYQTPVPEFQIDCTLSLSKNTLSRLKNITHYFFNPLVFPVLHLNYDMQNHTKTQVPFQNYWASLQADARETALTNIHNNIKNGQTNIEILTKVMMNIQTKINSIITNAPVTTKQMILYKRFHIETSNVTKLTQSECSISPYTSLSLCKSYPQTDEKEEHAYPSDFNWPKYLKGKADVLYEITIQPNTRMLFLGTFTDRPDFVLETNMKYAYSPVEQKKHIRPTTENIVIPSFYIRKITANSTTKGGRKMKKEYMKEHKKSKKQTGGVTTLTQSPLINWCRDYHASDLHDAMKQEKFLNEFKYVPFLTKQVTYNIPIMKLKYNNHKILNLLGYDPNKAKNIWDHQYTPEDVGLQVVNPFTFVYYNFEHEFFDKAGSELDLDVNYMKKMHEYIQNLDVVRLFAIIAYTLIGNHFVQMINDTSKEFEYPRSLLKKCSPEGLYFPLFFPMLSLMFENIHKPEASSVRMYDCTNHFEPSQGYINDSIKWFFSKNPTELDEIVLLLRQSQSKNFLQFWIKTSQQTKENIYQKLVRNVKCFTPKFIESAMRRLSDTLSEVISQAPPITKPMTLYRGDMGRWSIQPVNKEFNAQTFVSTSLSMKAAKNFMAQGRGKLCCLYVINVPAGSTILYLDGITQCNGEYEFLINSNTNFKVTTTQQVDYMMTNKYDETLKEVAYVCRYMHYYMKENFTAVSMVDLVGKASGVSGGRMKSSRKGLNKKQKVKKKHT